ncbi:MAG: hypothetical protein ABL908_05060 [Hyphomicrobium sp.]
MSRFLALILLSATIAPSMLNAACTSPAAVEGEQVYNTDYATMQFCDGTNWISMAASGSATAELDPKVGALTASNFCKANAGATQVICSTGAISLTADVTGNLPVTRLNSGTAASATTFWRGDGTWATPSTSQWLNGASGAIYYSGGNVGIGTNAPSTALDVRGTSNGMIVAGTSTNYMTYGFDGANFIATPSGSGNMIFGYNSGAGRTIAFYSAGTITPQLSILASGNVGIGSTAPAYSLDVNGVVRSTGIRVGAQRIDSNGRFYAYIGTAGAPSLSFDNNGTNGFYLPVANTVGWSTNGLERLRVDSGGNVGIGTTSPLHKLDVAGTGRFYSSNWAGRVAFGSGDQFYIDQTGTSSANAALSFVSWNGSAYQTNMTIAGASGNVGIGTTAPTTALDLNGAQTFRGMGVPAVSPVGQGRMYFDTTANVFKVSQNGGAYTTLGGGGALSALTDVALASPANGHVLTYNGTQWVNAAAGAAMSTTTMAANWPDGIVCRDDANTHNIVLYFIYKFDASTARYWYAQTGTSITFTTSTGADLLPDFPPVIS